MPVSNQYMLMAAIVLVIDCVVTYVMGKEIDTNIFFIGFIIMSRIESINEKLDEKNAE